MKGYIKVELILEVDSWDLDNYQVEDWVIDELADTNIHKDINIEETTIDSLQFDRWIKNWYEDLYL